MKLPESFIKQMQEQLGANLPTFLESLVSDAPVSMHYNPLKIEASKQEKREGVKWYSNGFYLKERPVFTLDPSFHAGKYYVQEASSMFLAEAIRQTVDTTKPLRALDLAAAPGGKSTLLASILDSGSFVLCNEVIKNRFKILDYNLIKWGAPNTHLSNHDSKDFNKLEGFFDFILLDAPCSGEGLFRKDKEAIGHWSPDHVEFCALRQQRILKNIVPLLSPGGTLIYSTCTYNKKENDTNSRLLESEYGLTHQPLELPDDWNIVPRKAGYQFYPHLAKGEGFYISCFKKEFGKENSFKIRSNSKKAGLTSFEKAEISRWVENPESLHFYKDNNEGIRAILKSHLDDHQIIQNSLSRYLPGTMMGIFKRDNFIPSPELALSLLVSKNLPSFELTKNQALRYLKKEIPELSTIPDGWALVKYEGLPLGWIKGIKKRINNYYPKEWRIRMAI
jgi:16S rRNA C967 or C1407 C5-methylase (RsmB/RsmF family)/NOL1/NOP2/fmu family ribosome biogenesis protein